MNKRLQIVSYHVIHYYSPQIHHEQCEIRHILMLNALIAVFVP